MKQQRNKILQKWVSNPLGREAIKELRKEFYDVPSFDENALVMAKNEGMREVVEYLIDMQEE